MANAVKPFICTQAELILNVPNDDIRAHFQVTRVKSTPSFFVITSGYLSSHPHLIRAQFEELHRLNRLSRPRQGSTAPPPTARRARTASAFRRIAFYRPFLAFFS
jgi:hypothetical protein